MEPCTLLPRYFPTFTKLPLWGNKIWSTYSLIEETFFKMDNNEKEMCKVPLCILFIIPTISFSLIYRRSTDTWASLDFRKHCMKGIGKIIFMSTIVTQLKFNNNRCIVDIFLVTSKIDSDFFFPFFQRNDSAKNYTNNFLIN